VEAIPIYINTFNRLTTTRAMVQQIAALAGAVPIIIDNDSAYPPLLEWYQQAPCEVIRLKENLGHHAPWLSGVIEADAAEVYGVTDCDLDLSGVPADALEVLQSAFRWRRPPVKSGLALRIDDVPRTQTRVIEWESRWWQRRCVSDRRFYAAAIDTTFALYRQQTPAAVAMRVAGVYAVRLAGEYQCRHVPWYCDVANLSDEDHYYFANANQSNTWRPGLVKMEQRQ
jgi:hypothetical protein